uniref:TVP38/TMEM64 family protein n=1 Tax=Ningiella ruwaisensis TaxID=2364274 RepID=UPI001F4FFD23|nr:VTT domain-containing protein [Ningiella ruwaisensis]
MKNKFPQAWFKKSGMQSTFLLLIACLIFTFLFHYSSLLASFDEQWIDRDIRPGGYYGPLYFLFISSLLTAVGAPRQIVAFLAGYAFGVAFGFLLALLASLFGCILSFYSAKQIFRPVLSRYHFKTIEKVTRFLNVHTTRKTIVLRLLPVGSNVLTNVAAGITDVRPSAFFIGSVVGYIPQTLIFALLGKGLLVGSYYKIMMSAFLLVVSTIVSWRLYQQHKQERAKLQCACSN